MCAEWFMWAIEILLIIIAWLISINWIQDLGWHVESRSKYLNFLLLYACELFYLLSYECMQQQSLDCYSFFRLIDGNCSHRSLHHIYPVGTVLLYLFNIFVVIQFPVLLHFFNFFQFFVVIQLPLLCFPWVVLRQINLLYIVTDFLVNKIGF